MAMTYTMSSSKRTRTAVGALAAAALLTLSACGGGSKDDSSADDPASASSSESAAAGDAAEPDLTGIPDVVAEVNGEEVTKEEFVPIYESTFQQAAAQAQMGGEAPDEDTLKQQTLDDLVNTELLAQEAESRGIEVTDDDIDAELTTLAEQNGMKTGDELLAAIAKQGMDEDTARSQVETQVLVEQLVDDEGGAKEPTDKQLRALYAQAKQQQAQSGQSGQKIPAFAKVRGQLVEQAKAQETGKIAQSLVDGLRKDADITINL
jgi:peptidyl-prolyl cis-trans isomerase SurA